ncbi:MAG: diguanylate cyclase, partial [Gammaproteobacteria bacterium]|nr:diguanylate cyclase [Gammaproteobacteria bacterium]
TDVGVILAGIDNLDHVTETHGTEAADRLLRETARVMLSNQGSRVIGQYSRNEIILWLTDCNHEAAQLAGRRILRDFEDVIGALSAEHDLPASLTLGIAAMDQGHVFKDATELVDAAHHALEGSRLGSLASTDDTRTPALIS